MDKNNRVSIYRHAFLHDKFDLQNETIVDIDPYSEIVIIKPKKKNGV
jgi:hypothetical protein